MELALEMSKFIGEIEYQLDHVVPMADFCFVGDIDKCYESQRPRLLWSQSRMTDEFTATWTMVVTACELLY